MTTKSSDSAEWTKTIFLPKTAFPMKADLPKREPKIIDFWEKEQVYKELVQSNDGPDFILHDGPPYANGNFHVGHALNKILKDIIIKFNLLKGKKAVYVPGWDCHGLPIELAVVKKLANKKKGDDKNPKAIREACRAYAADYIRLQAQDQSRFGVFWDSSDIESFAANKDYTTLYHTMSPSYEAGILEAFKDLYLKKIIYRGKKPVYWCSVTATAHAEAEVEYHDIESPSIYAGFPVANLDDTQVVIWTTTPWTLPANLAVCFNPDFTYEQYQTSKGTFILASGRAEAFFNETGFEIIDQQPLTTEQIEQLDVRHPFLDRASKVIFGDHVTLDAGSGVVHTAPGHGHDDYVVGQKYDLEAFSPVDHRGRYTDEAGVFPGVKYKDANPMVIDLLTEKGSLLHKKMITHSYPHSWRSKAPLIFRATPQWFMHIDPLREKAEKATKSIQWVPDWGERRFESMVQNRPDWCLSRQRYWGVPIPAFYCNDCDETLMTSESLEKIISIVQEKGVEEWFDADIDSLLPEDKQCSACGSKNFRRSDDILDVWFDSGISWYAVLKSNPNLKFPADLYLEGSDQHRGWFQSSLWPALAMEDTAPMKTVLTHGYVLDEKGHAMSKSLGNVISPVTDIIPKFGADVLRLWVSSEDYRTDNKIGLDHLNQIADSYRKIRNTFRYLLGNTNDGASKGSNEVTEKIDQWVLARLANLLKEIEQAYQSYEFHTVYHKAVNFCTVDLSNTYFEIVRDRLYCDAEDSKRRQSCLATLNHILESLLPALAPILSFTMEEAYQLYNSKEKESVFQLRWPDYETWENNQLIKEFQEIFDLRDSVNVQIEELRKNGTNIGSSTNVTVTTSSSFFDLEPNELADLLVVSKVNVDPNITLKVTESEEHKCPRCWLHRPLAESGLCERCDSVVT